MNYAFFLYSAMPGSLIDATNLADSANHEVWIVHVPTSVSSTPATGIEFFRGLYLVSFFNSAQ